MKLLKRINTNPSQALLKKEQTTTTKKKMEEEKILPNFPNSFYEVTIILIQKPDKYITRKTNVPMNRNGKIFSRILAS